MSDFSEVPPERKPPRGTEETDFPIPAQLPPFDHRVSGRERVMTILTAGIVAAFTAIIVVYGLQTIQRTAIWSASLAQQGDASVPASEMVEVYYQKPYATTPNITLSGPFSEDVLLVEQTPDHFKVKNKSSSSARSFHWNAEGQQ
jgi:hypothetical protein